MHDQSPVWNEIIQAINGCAACRVIPGKYNLCPEHDAMLTAAIGPCDDPRCPACRPRE